MHLTSCICKVRTRSPHVCAVESTAVRCGGPYLEGCELQGSCVGVHASFLVTWRRVTYDNNISFRVLSSTSSGDGGGRSSLPCCSCCTRTTEATSAWHSLCENRIAMDEAEDRHDSSPATRLATPEYPPPFPPSARELRRCRSLR